MYFFMLRIHEKSKYIFMFPESDSAQKGLTSQQTSQNINPLWSNDAIWWHGSGSPLAQVMTCCLKAPHHFHNQLFFNFRNLFDNKSWYNTHGYIRDINYSVRRPPLRHYGTAGIGATNADSSSVRFCGTHIRPVLQEVLKIWIRKMSSKNTLAKLLPQLHRPQLVVHAVYH